MGVHVAPRGQGLWWLSFIDPDLSPPPAEQRPGGPSFLGVVIVEATDMLSAVRRAHELGCNPGGAVQGFGPLPIGGVGPEFRDRLLSAQEAGQLPDPWG